MEMGLRSKNCKWLMVIDGVLVVSLALAFLAWLYEPFRLVMGPARLTVGWGIKPVLFPLILIALRVVISRKTSIESAAISQITLLSRFALALGFLLLFVVSMDGILALAGVPRGEPVFIIRGQGGEPVRADGSMVSDAELLWRFEPGKMFKDQIVNSFGFLDREFVIEKPPGMRRVICLGDSCTAQGAPPYSGILNDLLQKQPPGDHPWEAFNAAVHGYTVLQGLALFRSRIASLSPDVVTLFFGWNEHWLASEPDSVRLARAGSPFITNLRNAIAKKRMVTALAPYAKSSSSEWNTRVSPEEYGRALRDLISAIRMSGAVPLVLTAPRAQTLHRLIVHGGHARSVEEAVELHDMFVEITRNFARAEGVTLLDLAAEFDRPEDFSHDGIHFTETGLKHVAECIHRELLALQSGMAGD